MGRAKKSVEVEAQVIARGNIVPIMTETESEETVQYVSDEDAAREDRLVSEIRMITEQTKQVVLFNSTDDDGLQRLACGYFEHLIVCQCEILIGRQSAFTCRRQSVIVTFHEA